VLLVGAARGMGRGGRPPEPRRQRLLPASCPAHAESMKVLGLPTWISSVLATRTCRAFPVPGPAAEGANLMNTIAARVGVPTVGMSITCGGPCLVPAFIVTDAFLYWAAYAAPPRLTGAASEMLVQK